MIFNKHNENFFTLFGLPESYNIEVGALDQIYFNLQREFHPDKFGNTSPAEKLAAAQKSRIINDAYKILKDDLHRAEYLLFLHNIVVNQDNKEGVQPCRILLAEAMEMRENLLEAETLEEVKKLENKNKTMRDECVERLSKAFVEGDLKEAGQLCTRMKYLDKFVDEIRMKRLKIV